VSGENYKVLGDPELVGLCLKGDSKAWEALILRYRRLIYSIPVKFNFTSADASDVFQSVCLKLIEHLHDLKDESKVSAWLITTTTRQCIHVRSQRMRESSHDEDFEEPADVTVNVEDIQIRTQEQQNIRSAVDKLPDRCRRLLELPLFREDQSNIRTNRKDDEYACRQHRPDSRPMSGEAPNRVPTEGYSVKGVKKFCVFSRVRGPQYVWTPTRSRLERTRGSYYG
jgi:RNA polymerase sigma factor (sigma-70 family)